MPDTIDDRNDDERPSRSRLIHTVAGDFDSNLGRWYFIPYIGCCHFPAMCVKISCTYRAVFVGQEWKFWYPNDENTCLSNEIIVAKKSNFYLILFAYFQFLPFFFNLTVQCTILCAKRKVKKNNNNNKSLESYCRQRAFIKNIIIIYHTVITAILTNHKRTFAFTHVII